MKKIIWACVPLYIISIVAANIITANTTPLDFHWLGQTWVVTQGTFIVAASFFLRDGVQLAVGRSKAYLAIALSLIITFALSRHYNDLAWVTAASLVAFAFSETFDTEVFTRVKRRLGARIAISGVVGGTIDSAIFAVLGLSPLTTGIVPWRFIWTVIVAQVVIKCATSLIVGAALSRVDVTQDEVIEGAPA